MFPSQRTRLSTKQLSLPAKRSWRLQLSSGLSDVCARQTKTSKYRVQGSIKCISDAVSVSKNNSHSTLQDSAVQGPTPQSGIFSKPDQFCKIRVNFGQTQITSGRFADFATIDFFILAVCLARCYISSCISSILTYLLVVY